MSEDTKYHKPDKPNPFRVPEHYFDAMENKLLDAMSERKLQKNKKPTVRLLLTISSVAAGVLLILGFGFLWFQNEYTNTHVDYQSAISYLEVYAYDFEWSLIAELPIEFEGLNWMEDFWNDEELDMIDDWDDWELLHQNM